MFEIFKNFQQGDGAVKRESQGTLKPANSRKIAVVDTETTGVYPTRDRVIEVAIVLADWDGTVEERFVTLINPNRDLGETNIHGIRASDLNDAPAFSEVAGDIVDRLRDRVVVGHNIPFDLRMLHSEYHRMNLELPDIPHLCTLRLAYKLGPSSRNLRDCCSYFGVNPGRWHSALDDASATLELLMRFMDRSEEHGGFSNFEEHAYCDATDSSRTWPSLRASGKFKVRSESGGPAVHPYLADLTSRLPDPGSCEVASYYLLLDRVLEDRILTTEEAEGLMNLALSEGLGRSAILNAHGQYLDDLVLAALQDDVVSERERTDLIAVAALLGFGVDVLDERIAVCKENKESAPPKAATAERNCLQGMKVCFTGAMTCKIDGKPISRELAFDLAKRNGLEITENLTKKTDILVVADPHTMSGKAKKARDYGTRILAEDVFWRMIGVMIS